MDLYLGNPTAFNVMAKPIGAVCNLNCSYCYYLEKHNLYQQHADFRMPDEVLELYIKQYIESQEVPEVSFVWQGGEPTLLGIDFFEKAIRLQKKYAGKKRIENIFQTNGTTLNDEWCEFFRRHNILVGISIDGPGELHDKFRKTKNGGNTFDKVMHGIELLKKNKVEFNTLTVVHDYNVDYPLDIYHFLKETGSGYMQFIPIIERIANPNNDTSLSLVSPEYGDAAEITDWSVEPIKYGKFLTTIFDEWVRQDVGKYYVQHFDVALANWIREPNPGLCVFSKKCGHAMVIEHNGDIYSCDHYVYPENFLGNIQQKTIREMALSFQQSEFGEKKLKKLPQQCIACDYRFACHGGCPKNRVTETPEGEKGLNYLCTGYYHFFKHIHPYMQYMADELKAKRPPANVMEWVRKSDFRNSIRGKKTTNDPNIHSAKSRNQKKQKVERNDPCPCGSGKKYKQCCLKRRST